jgi:hypothetical protein
MPLPSASRQTQEGIFRLWTDTHRLRREFIACWPRRGASGKSSAAMNDFASNVPAGYAGGIGFWFVIGFVVGASSSILIVGALIGFRLRPPPRAYLVAMETLAVVLLVAATFQASAYAGEMWWFLREANRFEEYTFLQTHSGLAGVFHGLQIASVLAPQCFWFRRCRRSFRSILFIAVGTSLGLWLECVVIGITKLSADFLPQSW